VVVCGLERMEFGGDWAGERAAVRCAKSKAKRQDAQCRMQRTEWHRGLDQGRCSLRTPGLGIGEGRGEARTEGPGEGIGQGRGQGPGQGWGQGRGQGRTQGLTEGRGQEPAQGPGEGCGQGPGQGQGERLRQGLSQGRGRSRGQGPGQGWGQGRGQGLPQGLGEAPPQRMGLWWSSMGGMLILMTDSGFESVSTYENHRKESRTQGVEGSSERRKGNVRR
jgi:hypothetical protein